MTIDPVEALARVAYLLESDGADTYKVRAFRRAAAAIAPVDPDRLLELHRTGRLTALTDVGDTTAKVIAEALDGSVPGYLVELESLARDEPSPEALALRALLKGDCHSHSDWSDGGSPILEMARAAAALGHSYMVLTDHSPRLTVAHGLDAERLVRQLDVVAEVNEQVAPFRLLTGIEVDILEDGLLDQSEELLSRLDVVVASVHSKLRMDKAQMTKRMVRAIESPHTDILGHCTGRLLKGKGRPQSEFDPAEVFAACARTMTAVEINSRPERRDPPLELLKAALDAGCIVSIDTDAHAPGQLEWLLLGCQQAVDAGVPVERIVNARDEEWLLGWAASHAA
ncbi:MAG TPA: PHP domain-containing protein [Acidimicrobiales bacterium]|nr:PHP domain-containing protein [Acidimicrobiales bacterium]